MGNPEKKSRRPQCLQYILIGKAFENKKEKKKKKKKYNILKVM
jgi:hypothetical protein